MKRTNILSRTFTCAFAASIMLVILPSLPSTAISQIVAISSFNPIAGNVGTTVTINGSNFNSTPANNIVYFGAVRAAVLSATSNRLKVTVPAGASYAPITVTTGGMTAYSHLPFTVTFPGSHQIDSKTFDLPVNFPNGSRPYWVAVGDLDGDGKPDVVAGNNDIPMFTLFRNTCTTGSITFDPVLFSPGFTSITVFAFLGDIDGDGMLDLVCPIRDELLVAVFRNTSTAGNFSFAPRVDFGVGTNPRRVAIQDYDGDGKPDLAVANLSDNTISVLRNSSSIGSISFESKVDFATERGYKNNIFAGDIDGDGKPDLIVYNFMDESFSVLRNTSSVGSLSFAGRVNFPIGDVPLLATGLGDLDGDGKLDVALVGQNANEVLAFRNTSSVGNIAFAAGIHLGTGVLPNCVGLGDIDGDGKTDLAVTNYSSMTISVFKNQSSSGTISFADGVEFAAGMYPVSLAVNDLDGDLQPDIVIANDNDQNVSVIRNTIALPVAIDIKPGNKHNFINPKSKEAIPVAILTTATFDATTVIPSSVEFGPDGAKAIPGKCRRQDVDHDGDLDMVCHFKTQQTGIQCGDTKATLIGKTSDERAIIGTDAIQTIGCCSHPLQKETAAEEVTIPADYALLQNHPNPFNPETEIRFELSEANHIVVRIFNILGEEIRTLVDAPFEAGYHRVLWDGKDRNGKPVASGVYLYQLRAGDFSQVRKMSLLR